MSRTSTSKERSRILDEVHIYSSENEDDLDLQGVLSFISGLFPSVEVLALPSPIRSVRRRNWKELATRLASARIKDPDARDQSFEPMFGEVEYELRIIEGDSRAGGVVYDGRKLGRIYQPLLRGSSLSTSHIVLTDRLVSTFSEDDLRQHLRTVVPGFPSIISIPGIVEAPARPRAYCVERRTLEMMGASQVELEGLKRKFAGRFVDYGDAAIEEVLKGMALQALMFHLTLQPFCRNKGCRLFNAHWQEDLVESQVSHGGLCATHARLIRELGRKPEISWLA